MTRDHRKLKVFEMAHGLVLSIYRATQSFPSEERFGLQSQLRRGAMSIPANIVEGCARRSTSEYVHFLNIALGSAAEVDYLVDLSRDLEFIHESVHAELKEKTQGLLPALTSLVQTLTASLPNKSPKPRA